MHTPAWDDLDDFDSTDDFAVLVTLRMQSGQVRTFPGIYDDPYLNPKLGGYEADTHLPKVTCQAKYVVGVSRGDRLDVAGKKFDVLSAPHVDGTGYATMELAPTEIAA